MNENNVNQNVAPEVNPTVAPVDATPTAPVEAPVQPVVETPVAPAAVPAQPEVPVQPVASNEFSQPVTPGVETPQPVVAPSMDPNAQFSTQPTEQPAVQPAVQPGVPPVVPPTVAQPVAQPVGDGVAMQPKKKNNLPFILIVVLLLVIIGGLAAFLIFNNTKDNDSGSKKDNTKTEEKKKENGSGDIPKEIANKDRVTVGQYSMDIPVGYVLYGYENGATIMIDQTNKVQLTMAEVEGANISAIEENPANLKSTMEGLGYTVESMDTVTVGTVKWFCAYYHDADNHDFLYIATNLGTDAIEGYIYNAGAKSYTDVVKGINDVLSTAKKDGSSFAEKRAAYDNKKMDLFYYDIFK